VIEKKQKHIHIHDSVAHPVSTAIIGDESIASYVEVTDSPNIMDKVGPEDFMPLKLLGSGSFGEVYLVRELATGKLFAMKVLSKQKILGQNLVRYAKTERDVLSYTIHNFIVQLNYAF
jgi:serine/threonine protein kinase